MSATIMQGRRGDAGPDHADPITVIGLLREKAEKLGELSTTLADVERKLEPVANQYQSFVDDFEVGLWKAYEDSEYAKKLPPEPMRLKLAHKAMDPAVLGRYVGLTNSRKRLEQRIRDLKLEVEAQRSILSALKEMEGLR